MLDMIWSPTWNYKKVGGDFANVFWCNISSKNCFHKHDIYNLVYMIIPVKMQLMHKNVKSVENILRRNKNHKTHAIKALRFLVPIWRFQNFRHILQNPKLKQIATLFSTHSLDLCLPKSLSTSLFMAISCKQVHLTQFRHHRLSEITI